MAASLAVIRTFGLLITVCNRGRHRSLSLGFEVAVHQGAELVSIRDSQRPTRFRGVREFMEDVSPRLMEHVCRFRDVPHPVVGFGICTHEFNGISWAEDNGVEGEYLDLWAGISWSTSVGMMRRLRGGILVS